jgi:predicted CXXCH cytochrome family protein
MKKHFSIGLAVLVSAVLFLSLPRSLRAQTDCLSCHGTSGLTDSSGKSISVDADKFHSSIHGGLKCTDCHTNVKGYPHEANAAVVDCSTCHADEASGLAGSVHANASEHPCLSCHGDPHQIVAKTDPQSTVYPLNIPKTCGSCHGNPALAKQHGLANVYGLYMDSIHGFAVSKEGLLVAANCTSCHGSHGILSHTNPKSPTFRTNIPATCGSCHVGINQQYQAGIHGKAVAAGNPSAPVCTDCHTAHGIVEPTSADFRMQSTPVCGSCHRDKFTTYRDTFHSQLGLLGGYVQTARCWDCHEAHDIRPASDPQSPIAPANLVATCGRCHAGANLSFVQYQPHANARNRRLNPALYYIRLFMNLLLASVLTFFLIHTVLWLIRSHWARVRNGSAQGGKHA